MYWYLTKVDTRKDKNVCTKEDANAQGKMQIHKGRSVQKQVQGQFRELQRRKSVDDNSWE